MRARRIAWLVAAPLLAGTWALVLGGIAASSFADVLSDEKPTPGLPDAGRAVLASTLGDLTDLDRLAPVAAGVLLAAMAWVVGLGHGAQRLFPRRRRIWPALTAVVVSGLAGWVALGVVAGNGGADVEVRTVVVAVATVAVVMAVAVFLAAAYWSDGEPVPVRRPPVRPYVPGWPVPTRRVGAPRPAGHP